MKLLAVTASDRRFVLAQQLAQAALAGELADYTFGATHYHAVDVAPSWAAGHTPCVVIGRHAFYNDIA